MTMKIRISEEIAYLQKKEQFRGRFADAIMHDAHGSSFLEISEEQATDLRELCSDWLQSEGFDLKYELTAEGEICERLIDKLYIP